ncbi:TerD family protein [Paenibacillus camerounensis]|uniref:TerD family protein n=1 Tax=Paenibacillus camerounensis TaxID=1243663 RepID=UPI0005A7DECE|nr:TerD family protein [Paenibacillus camerounensis]
MNINTIYLRRARKIIVGKHTGNGRLAAGYLAAAARNLEALGFALSPDLFRAVSVLPKEDFEVLYEQLVADLKVMVGAHVKYEPMYPGFPEQVMLEHEAILYLNAMYHYYTWDLPVYDGSTEREPLQEQVKLKTVGIGYRGDFFLMIRRLIQAKGSISAADKEDIDAVIAALEPEELEEILPADIPFKENTAFVTSSLLKHDKANLARLGRYFKTATDVLRLAVAWSDGDASLAAPARFRKFKRSERRLLLGLLEQCHPLTEDMLRHKDRWIRLGEILHPSEYKLRYARCEEAWDILRNNKPCTSFNSSVELALKYKQVWNALDLLIKRPGEFARRLDHLLRGTEHTDYVVLAFGEAAEQVSTPVLLQVKNHFSRRLEERELRVFFPKGNVAKAFAVPDTLPEIEAGVCQNIVSICEQALIRRFAELPPLGSAYVDERLKNYHVPFSQRSASKALHTLVRGSRLPMGEGDTIRFFSWWKEGKVDGVSTGRVDIDLSAVMYDHNWNYVEHISYTNLRSSKYLAHHSGDIVSAPLGASEFIDLHIPSIMEYGGRYVVASLNSFTEQPYCNLPECFTGWMMRRKPGSGEIYEPSTVVNKIDVTADTRIAIPVILDLVERAVIWTDLSLTRDPNYYNNVEGNQKGMMLIGKAMTQLKKPDLYDLFMLHVKARGQLTGSPRHADTVFTVEQGLTPFDIEQIMAEYVV